MPEPAGTRAEVCRLLGELRPELTQLGVRSLTLFGSAARDALDAASDVDVLVEFEGPAQFDPFMDLKLLLEQALGRRVDLVTQGALKPALLARIQTDLQRVA